MAQPSVLSTPTKPTHGCLMDYSEFSQFQKSGQFLNFSIKYVIEGVENYTVNGLPFKVQKGQYLLTGFGSGGSVLIDEKENVKGMCMALSPKIIHEVLSQHLQPAFLLPQCDFLHLFNCDEFIENKYNAGATNLGNYLTELEKYVLKQPPGFIEGSSELYYTVTEHLLADYLPLQKMFRRVKAVKHSTRKELFRRLLQAKEQLEDSFAIKQAISEIAISHGFSEYHFFRLFKNTFQISPYQYQLNQRLNFAKDLLLKKQLSVSDVAFATGFNDVHAFSKAFKKKYNHSPSDISARPISRI